MYRDQWMKLLEEVESNPENKLTLHQAYGISILQRLMEIDPEKESLSPRKEILSPRDRLALRAISRYAEDWSLDR